MNYMCWCRICVGDEEWAKLSPIHLLLSRLPEKNFDSARHQPAGREVGRRQFAEGGQLMDTNFQHPKTY